MRSCFLFIPYGNQWIMTGESILILSIPRSIPMSAWKLPLFALTLMTFVGAAACAEDIPPSGYPAPAAEMPAPNVENNAPPLEAPAITEPAPAPAPAPAAAPAPAPETKAETASPKKEMKAVHKKIKDMTPEERAELQQKLETWFKSLPLEKQANIKANAEGKKWKPKKARAVPAPVPAPAPAPPPA